MPIKFVGGRITGLVQTVIRGILGIIFIIVGIVMTIFQKQILFLVIFGVMGLISLLSAWWWWRRAQRF